MGILYALSYIGSALAMPVASMFAESWGWRSTFLGLPLVFGFSGLLIFLIVTATPEKAGYKADWIMTLAGLCGAGALLSFAIRR